MTPPTDPLISGHFLPSLPIHSCVPIPAHLWSRSSLCSSCTNPSLFTCLCSHHPLTHYISASIPPCRLTLNYLLISRLQRSPMGR